MPFNVMAVGLLLPAFEDMKKTGRLARQLATLARLQLACARYALAVLPGLLSQPVKTSSDWGLG